MKSRMKKSFTRGGLLSLVLSSITSAYGQSEFRALDKPSRQETGIASSRLDDSALDRVEGDLDITSGSVDPASQQAAMQAAVLERTVMAHRSVHRFSIWRAERSPVMEVFQWTETRARRI
ncbi:hypothetical protein [Methylocaldum sp. RMAD-M]|jgi:hypothetical protein|uniref:hypothetical protein n=2 Tax=Methylocaldum TaxID=73778 RepID=UPI0012EBDEF4|nr:hypothetical protein [Methylocaldum sp. RMAD-M]